MALRKPRDPAPVALPKPAPAPIGRDTLLAVVHHQLAGLEQRRRATQAAPAPQDRVPRPPVDDDGLPRLAATPAGPLDAPAGVPQARPGEPFHYSGTVEGSKVDEFAIDWPEPGAPAMVIATGKVVKDYLTITGMTRTRNRVSTHGRIITGWSHDGVSRHRALLTPDMTHFKVEAHGGKADWSLQLVGPADLDRLVDEREGNGSFVLAVRPGKPMEVLVHANSGSWNVEFVCGCWAGDKCACSKPKRLGYFAPSVWESGEGMAALILPRPGLLVGATDKEADPWRLRLRPIGSEN